MNLISQFTYNLPENWTIYLFGQTGLETFKFYPLVLGALLVISIIAVAVLITARIKRKNRPLSGFLKLVGKIAFGELLAGLFIVFSRWQTLGLLSMRIFLLVWVLSLPIACVVVILVYIRRFSTKVRQAKEKVTLSKYLPSRKK